jgi:hypothetical protein
MRSMSHCLVVTVVVVGRSKTVRANTIDVGDGREENEELKRGNEETSSSSRKGQRAATIGKSKSK